MHSITEQYGTYAWFDRNMKEIPGVMTYMSKSVDAGVEALNVLIAPNADEEEVREQIIDLFRDSFIVVQLSIFRLTHHSLVGANSFTH